jgi:hypothetical protein
LIWSKEKVAMAAGTAGAAGCVASGGAGTVGPETAATGFGRVDSDDWQAARTEARAIAKTTPGNRSDPVRFVPLRKPIHQPPGKSSRPYRGAVRAFFGPPENRFRVV